MAARKPVKPVMAKRRTQGPVKRTQIGDENQREGFNAVRGTYGTTPRGRKVPASKMSKSAAKSRGAVGMAAYKSQRAGGKGK